MSKVHAGKRVGFKIILQLNAFSDDREHQAIGERFHCVQQAYVGVGIVHTTKQEATIEFDLIEVKFPEVAHARAASAKCID